MKRQDYKAKASELEPVINIGKSGIGAVVEELKCQLKIREMVKVKFLKSALIDENRKELSEKLSRLTDSELIDVRGNTAVFRRKG